MLPTRAWLPTALSNDPLNPLHPFATGARIPGLKHPEKAFELRGTHQNSTTRLPSVEQECSNHFSSPASSSGQPDAKKTGKWPNTKGAAKGAVDAVGILSEDFQTGMLHCEGLPVKGQLTPESVQKDKRLGSDQPQSHGEQLGLGGL